MLFKNLPEFKFFRVIDKHAPSYITNFMWYKIETSVMSEKFDAINAEQINHRAKIFSEWQVETVRANEL